MNYDKKIIFCSKVVTDCSTVCVASMNCTDDFTLFFMASYPSAVVKQIYTVPMFQTIFPTWHLYVSIAVKNDQATISFSIKIKFPLDPSVFFWVEKPCSESSSRFLKKFILGSSRLILIEKIDKREFIFFREHFSQ